MKVFAKENIEINSLFSFIFLEYILSHESSWKIFNINACILFAILMMNIEYR